MPNTHLRRIPERGADYEAPSAVYATLSTANGVTNSVDLIFTLQNFAGSTVAQAEQIMVNVLTSAGSVGTVHLFTTGGAGVGSFVLGQGAATGRFVIQTAATGIASITMYSGGAGTGNVRWIRAEVVSADGVGGQATLASVSI